MVVGQMLGRAVKYFPQKTAAVCGDTSFSYGELPKSGSGKILKKVLREKYWEGYDRKVH